MANKEQLAILKQGVAAWNKWREENPDEKIDLRGAELEGLNLNEVNFYDTDLRMANLKNCTIVCANFSECQLGCSRIGIYIDKIFQIWTLLFFLFTIIALFTAKFEYIFRRETPLTKGVALIYIFTIFIFPIVYFTAKYCIYKYSIVVSEFSKYDFQETNFNGSDLRDSIFDNANIGSSIFDNTILDGTSWINIKKDTPSCNNTIIRDYNVFNFLIDGGTCGVSLRGKKLEGARLVNFELRDVDFRETYVMKANLSGADITGAKLWGSAREGWIIDGIRCEYVYWDEAGEVRTPPDRDFRPGEFEELYKQLPTFEYIFEQGFTPLDPLIMQRVVQAVNERHKEFSLELVNFDKRGQPHATFTVCRLDYVDAARKSVTEIYEKTIEYLMQENEEKNRLIERQNNFIDQLIKKTPSIEDLKKMGDTYNNYGQVAAMGKKATASGNTFQQITAELSRLHEEMQRSAKTPEQRAAAEDVAKAAQAAREQNEPAMLQHLKNAGKFALDCAKTVGTDVAAEYLKKVTGM